jgi:hypothetical protein
MNIQNKSASIGMKLFVVFSFAMLILSSVGVFALNISGVPSVSSFKNGQVAIPFGGENSLVKGLVGYYKLDDGATGYAINEVGSDAINLGATTGVYGVVNTGFDFYGSANEYVDTSTIIGAETSISFWMYPYSNSDIFGTIESATNKDGYSGVYENGFFSVYYLSNNQFVNVVSVDIGSQVASPFGVHIVLTINSSNYVSVYVNGNKVVPSTYNWMVPSSVHDRPLVIGAYRENAVVSFDGRLDEFGVWDRALGASEVSKLYNNHLGLTY